MREIKRFIFHKEIYFSEINFETGIATTTEPHGITAKTAVLICPNNFKIGFEVNNNMSIPIEWVMSASNIHITAVDEMHLKITNQSDAVVKVDLSNISNQNVDITQFHFEIPIGWRFTNLPDGILNFKLLKKGYINYSSNYRDVSWDVKFDNDQVKSMPYLNLLGTPSLMPEDSKHGIFASETWIIDLRTLAYDFGASSYFIARRSGYARLVTNTCVETVRNSRECSKEIYDNNLTPIGLNSIGSYSNQHAYYANGSRIRLYDLGGY